MLSIVGASGSGKSTLLNILAGYESPSAGDVNVGEFDLLGINQKEAVEYRKKEVGFVWQQTGKNLVPYLDISSNIELPMMSSELSAIERKSRGNQLIEFLILVLISRSYRFPKFELQIGWKYLLMLQKLVILNIKNNLDLYFDNLNPK